ncbi:MAG: hemerythrin family protein [Campylobacterales bacterium]|nr:hemerythrin family protein [Campylobacterales bacterium]
MEKLEWSESLKLGIVVIDYQHRKIINIINELIDEMLSSCDIESILSMGDDLVEAVLHHLDYEEKILKEISYDDYDTHKEIHNQYIKQTNYFYEKIRHGDISSIGEFIEFLKDWWVYHITNEDIKYKDFCIKSKFN